MRILLHGKCTRTVLVSIRLEIDRVSAARGIFLAKNTVQSTFHVVRCLLHFYSENEHSLSKQRRKKIAPFTEMVVDCDFLVAYCINLICLSELEMKTVKLRKLDFNLK